MVRNTATGRHARGGAASSTRERRGRLPLLAGLAAALPASAQWWDSSPAKRASLRCEMRGGMFLRGGRERTLIDGRSGADLTFDALRIQIGWLF